MAHPRLGWIAILLTGCSAIAPEKQPPDTNPKQVIGKLKWEITEGATEKVLGRGEREILLQEVVFKEQKLISKQIPLSDHFILSMAESPSPSKAEKKGFGLTVTRDDVEKCFSWDWFIVNYEDHAYKLQEAGSLRIKLAQVGSGWEVTRTEFLDDASLRTFIVGESIPDKPTWRVKIFKGSFVRWPSRVNGTVVPNN
jgi:hypothetical protein